MGAKMRVAYLINRNPAASHSFIRREIAAIEVEDAEGLRYSIRALDLSQLSEPLLTLAPLVCEAARESIARVHRSIRTIALSMGLGDWRFSGLGKTVAGWNEGNVMNARMRKLEGNHLRASLVITAGTGISPGAR